MKKRYVLSRGDLIFIMVAMFLAGFIANTFLYPQQIQYNTGPYENGEKTVTMALPAVDSDGNGVIGELIMKIRPGSGQVLVNVNNVLAQFDTQLSGRLAAKAAAAYTKKDLNKFDIIYDIKVNATVIEGPSAGAAMATAIVLGLEGIPSRRDVMITGTIKEDGTIGQVGAILEKAKAAKDGGATIFLVPPGQSTQLSSDRIRECRQFDGINICQIRYIYGHVNVGKSINITIEEVSKLEDILKYFRQVGGTESNQTNSSA